MSWLLCLGEDKRGLWALHRFRREMYPHWRRPRLRPWLASCHTRTWQGTAWCSSMIGALPRELMAAQGQVYPSSSGTCSMKGPSMRSQLAAMFLVFSLSANAQTLSGAIDMHAHAAPDGVQRKLDAVDLARLAKERGMRAIVLKNHYEPT